MEQKAINISDQLNNQSNEQDEEELSMPPADNLPDLLNLRSIGNDKYLGTTYTGWYFDRTFGGVTFSQALIAACRTVEDPSRFLYSAHSNFISAGKAKDPIVYKVKRTRDAKTFSNRKVHRQGVERKLERQFLPTPRELPEPDSCPSVKNRKQRFFMDVPGEWRVAEMNAEECPIANEERALSTGQFFNSKGELVASMAQEGMVRYDAKTNIPKSEGTSMTTKSTTQEGVKNTHAKL
eukprot:gene5612-6797_t